MDPVFPAMHPLGCVLWAGHTQSDIILLVSAACIVAARALRVCLMSEKHSSYGCSEHRRLFWYARRLKDYPADGVRCCVETDGDWLCISVNVVRGLFHDA